MFITFEGGDGSGKSTHAGRLEKRLTAEQIPVLLVREPGSTTLGQYLREWLKRDVTTVPLAELLLFEAARAQLTEELIRPALSSGKVVIADRFSDSTLAYQGYGRGLDLSLIRALNAAATGGLVPDLTILLDVPSADALRRAELRASGVDGSRFEDLPGSFHSNVVAGFRTLAATERSRWVVIDSSSPVEEVERRVWDAVRARLHPDSRGQR